jgi:tRNA(Ile2) C34 agmatinyltransferase TiaS
VLDARCPECGKRAKVNDGMSEVKCEYCGFQATYDEYIEIMKSKAESMADDFHLSWDKRPF